MYMAGIIICISILIGAGYTWLVYKFAQKEVWAWWHTFTSLALSVAFAFAIGMALFQHQENAQDGEKIKRALSRLSIEMTSNLLFLDDPYQPVIMVQPDSGVKINFVYLSIDGLNEAVNTGLFDSSNTWYMNCFIRDVKEYNYIREVIYLMIVSGDPNPMAGCPTACCG